MYVDATPDTYHPLSSHSFTVQEDRRIYDRCYTYDSLGLCSPNVYINPDLAIVAGSTPTLYGEVESNTGRRDDSVIDKLNQAVSRIYVTLTSVSQSMPNPKN